jgi:hypothetical protein
VLGNYLFFANQLGNYLVLYSFACNEYSFKGFIVNICHARTRLLARRVSGVPTRPLPSFCSSTMRWIYETATMRVGEEALDPATCCWVRRRAPKVKAFLAVVAGMASLVVICFHTRERTRWASPSSSTPRRRPALVRSLPSSPAPFSEAFPLSVELTAV